MVHSSQCLGRGPGRRGPTFVQLQRLSVLLYQRSVGLYQRSPGLFKLSVASTQNNTASTRNNAGTRNNETGPRNDATGPGTDKSQGTGSQALGGPSANIPRTAPAFSPPLGTCYPNFAQPRQRGSYPGVRSTASSEHSELGGLLLMASHSKTRILSLMSPSAAAQPRGSG
jgi:hypothetical protein